MILRLVTGVGFAPTGLVYQTPVFWSYITGTSLTFSLYLQIVNRLVISNSTLFFRRVSSLLSLASLVLYGLTYKHLGASYLA